MQRKKNNMKPGPTGKFPEGKINDDDQGELVIGVRIDDKTGFVVIDLGLTGMCVGIPPESAIELARLIAEEAGAKTIIISREALN